jgi:hypothetical protein
VIHCGAAQIVTAFVVELSLATICSFPLTSIITDVDSAVFFAIIHTWAPMGFVEIVFICMMEVVQAPSPVVIDVCTTSVENSLPLELSGTCWGLLQFALTACGTAWTSKLAFRVAPLSNVAQIILSSIRVCSGKAVFPFDETLKECPWLLLNTRPNSEELRSERRASVRRCKIERLTKPCAGCIASLAGLREMPTSTLCKYTLAGGIAHLGHSFRLLLQS